MKSIFCSIISNRELLIASLAIAISAFSVFISIRGLHIQRLHNFKSLRPICYISIMDYDDSLIIHARNFGVGPLIMQKLIVSDQQGNVKNNLIAWMPAVPEGLFWKEYFGNTENYYVITPGEKLPLLEIDIDIDNHVQVQFLYSVRNILKDLMIEIDYIDIYDNKMPTYSKELTWFGRNL